MKLDTNLKLYLAYLGVSVIALGLSALGFLAKSEFSYYPLVITAIAFFFGFIYLLFLMLASRKEMVVTKETKGLNLVTLMGSNFLRFLVMVLALVSSFLFIYFVPHTEEIPKWVYALLLINGLPMVINVMLFYARSKYLDK